MRIVQLLIYVCLWGALSSCSDDDINPTPPEVFDYFIVASKNVTIIDPDTNQEIECLIVRYSDKKDWFTLNKDNIRAFENDEGFEYEIEVRTIDLNEGKGIPLYGYELVNIISKEKKDTEGLPENF